MREGRIDITPERARAQENLNLESLLKEVTPKAHGKSPCRWLSPGTVEIPH
jgi:hypothetical protein